MSEKKEETQSVHLRLNKVFLDEIDQFAKEYHFTSRTDAMRFLLASGLKYQKTASDLIQRKLDK